MYITIGLKYYPRLTSKCAGGIIGIGRGHIGIRCGVCRYLVNLEHTCNVPYTREEEVTTPTPTMPGELEEAIKATAETVQTLSQNLNSTMIQLTRVSTSIEALNSTLTTIMALNGIFMS